MAGSGNLEDVILRVSPEVMYAKAQEAETQLNAMKRSFETMQNMALNSSSYWQGEAGDTHRTTYEACQKKAENIFKRLKEHVDDLRLMAAGYESAEKAAANVVETLSSDVIF